MLRQICQRLVRDGTREIGKAEPMAPLDQLCSRVGKAPYSGNGSLAAPDDDPVAQIRHPLDGSQIGRRCVKHIDIVCQARFHVHQRLQDGERKPVVRLGQLQQIDVAGHQPLGNREGRQPVRVSGCYVQQNPKRPGEHAQRRKSCRRICVSVRHGVGAKLCAKLELQIIPPQQADRQRLILLRAVKLQRIDLRVKRPGFNRAPQLVNGGDSKLRRGSGLCKRLVQLCRKA